MKILIPVCCMIFVLGCTNSSPININTMKSNHVVKTKDSPTNQDLDREMDQVDNLVKESNIEQALNKLDFILSHRPDHAYAVRLKAALLWQMNQKEKSCEIYEHFLELKPADDKTRITLVKRYSQLQEAQKAIPHLTRLATYGTDQRQSETLLNTPPNDRPPSDEIIQEMIARISQGVQPRTMILPRYLSPGRNQTALDGHVPHMRMKAQPIEQASSKTDLISLKRMAE